VLAPAIVAASYLGPIAAHAEPSAELLLWRIQRHRGAGMIGKVPSP
jgi:hypothetical protein